MKIKTYREPFQRCFCFTHAAMAEGSVLASVVRCTYKIDIPSGSGKVTAEETFDFIFSPDGTHCYKKSKIH